MPPSRTNQESGRLGVQRIAFPIRSPIFDLSPDRIAQINLALDQISPCRCVGVLEVRHIDAGARIQRVDQHLALGRARDFHAPVLQVTRNGCDGPFRVAYLTGFFEEIWKRAALDLLLALRSRAKQFLPLRLETCSQPRDEPASFRCQYLRERCRNLGLNLHSAELCRRMCHETSLVFMMDAAYQWNSAA